MKFKTIVKNRYIENTIDSHLPYLFTIGCPEYIKTFTFDGDIKIIGINENYNRRYIHTDTYIAKIYSDIRMTSNTEPVYEFKFHIGKPTIINKEFDDGHTIMIFAEISKCELYTGITTEINIKSIKVGK